jgi:hypothetical protein
LDLLKIPAGWDLVKIPATGLDLVKIPGWDSMKIPAIFTESQPNVTLGVNKIDWVAPSFLW